MATTWYWTGTAAMALDAIINGYVPSPGPLH